MWNNVLPHIVKYLTSFDVKWNLPTFASANISHAEGVFHISQKYFTCLKGKFRWKKHLLLQVLFSGSPCWARTKRKATVASSLRRKFCYAKVRTCSCFAWAGCRGASSGGGKKETKNHANRRVLFRWVHRIKLQLLYLVKYSALPNVK